MPLYRRSQSPGASYWCRFTGPDGRQVRRSTGSTSRADAERFERQLRIRLEDDYARASQLPDPRTPGSQTWIEASMRWLIERADKRSLYDDKCHIKWLSTCLDTYPGEEALDQLLLSEFTRETLARIRHQRIAEGSSRATANRTMAFMRSVFNMAKHEWDWSVPDLRFEMYTEESRERWLTPETVHRLLAELPDHLGDPVRFTLATGLRKSVVTGLTWDQVDFERRIASVPWLKNRRRKTFGVPLNNDAILVLRRQQGRHPERVFCRHVWREGDWHWMPVENTNTPAWRKALKRAGITDFRWHDLRHTWASWHMQSGTDPYHLKALGGWSSLGMVEKYAHLAVHHLAPMASNIETALHVVEPDAEDCASTTSSTRGGSALAQRS